MNRDRYRCVFIASMKMVWVFYVLHKQPLSCQYQGATDRQDKRCVSTSWWNTTSTFSNLQQHGKIASPLKSEAIVTSL